MIKRTFTKELKWNILPYYDIITHMWVSRMTKTHTYSEFVNECSLFINIKLTSLVVWWLELLTTNHEVPGSILGSTMGIFPCRGRIPVVTMVWVVSRIKRKVEISVTRSHNSINSDWIHDRDLLAGGDLTTKDSQHISS